MRKQRKKFFRRLLAKVQRAYKKFIRFITGKGKTRGMIVVNDDPPFTYFPDEYTRDTYTPDPSRDKPASDDSVEIIEIKNPREKK